MKEPTFKFWMVYVEGQRMPTYQHPEELVAKNEAERLARMNENLGRKVYILESTDYCSVDLVPVKWDKTEYHNPVDVPF